MTKPSRSIAVAALLVACVLPSAGFLSHGSHGHDHEHFGGHHHDCTICCLRDHPTLTTTAAPVPATACRSAQAVASMRRRCNDLATLSTSPGRGPPA